MRRKRIILAVVFILILGFPIIAESFSTDAIYANASSLGRLCDSVLNIGGIFGGGRAPTPGDKVRSATKPFTDASSVLNDSNIGSALIQEGDWPHGVVLFDANGDNLTDVYIAHNNAPLFMYNSSLDLVRNDLGNRLYINIGNGQDNLPRFIETGAMSNVRDLGKQSTGASVGDYDNDGRLDLYVTSSLIGIFTQDDQRQPPGYQPTYGFHNPGEAGNVLYHNDGNVPYTLPDGRVVQVPVFSDRTELAGVSGGNYNSESSSWVDISKDGLLDLFVANTIDVDFFGQRYAGLPPQYLVAEPNQLFLNNGDGTFANITNSSGVAGEMLLPLRNSDRAAVLKSSPPVDSLGRIVNPRGQISHHATWYDYDGDGYPDLFVANEDNPITVYHNNGDKTFTDITRYTSLYMQGNWMDVGLWDFNGTGKMSLFVTNVGANTFANPQTFSNGSIKFTRYNALLRYDGVSVRTVNGSQIPVPNFTYVSNKVRVDWSTRLPPTIMTLHPGCHWFGAVPQDGLEPGEFGWGAIFPDVTNSGYSSIYWVGGVTRCDPTVRGSYCMNSPGRLLENMGNGQFVDVSVEAHILNILGVNYTTGARMTTNLGEEGSGLSTGDLNGDGYPDMVVANDADYTSYGHDINGSFINGEIVTVPTFVFINPGGTNHWIKIVLQGTSSNRAGIGAEIQVTRTDGKTITQLVLSGDVAFGQTDLAKTFGLGSEGLRTVRVLWPSGTVDLLGPLQPDQTVKIIEGTHPATPSGSGT